jgi:ubiquinone biosynthesis protein UbiJ
MEQQIKALLEHVDNLTFRVIRIEERLEKLEQKTKELDRAFKSI